ncbi:34119_t:CDS:1, partial [Racocetra persica]
EHLDVSCAFSPSPYITWARTCLDIDQCSRQPHVQTYGHQTMST